MRAIEELLSDSPLIDGHNDLLWRLRTSVGYEPGDVRLDQCHRDRRHTDLPRLRAGRVGGQFWSAYVPSSLSPGDAVIATLEQIDALRRLIDHHSDDLRLALSPNDVEAALGDGRIASLIALEGGHSIGGSLRVLRQLHELGVRCMALTHNDNNTLADAATDVTRHGGLSEFGRAVVDELNDLGIMIDLSHASEATALDAIGQSQAPAILSHSGARGVCDHPRNATDEVLRALANKGGVCMVTFAAGFVSPDVAKLWSEALIEQRRMVGRHPDSPSEVQQSMDTWFAERPVVGADIARVADHIDHIRDVSGIDHVGIGSDFDGAPQVAAGLDDVSTYPQLFYHLRDRGYSDADLKAIAGRNVLRVWRQTEVVRNRRRP